MAEEKPKAKTYSEMGWAFLNVAVNTSGSPAIGAIIKTPDDTQLFVGRESLVKTIHSHPAGVADVLVTALEAVEKRERTYSPLYQPWVKRDFSH